MQPRLLKPRQRSFPLSKVAVVAVAAICWQRRRALKATCGLVPVLKVFITRPTAAFPSQKSPASAARTRLVSERPRSEKPFPPSSCSATLTTFTPVALRWPQGFVCPACGGQGHAHRADSAATHGLGIVQRRLRTPLRLRRRLVVAGERPRAL